MKKKKAEKLRIIVPEGYDIEDIFDTDDSDFKEQPIKSEEVEIIFERSNDRKESGARERV